LSTVRNFTCPETEELCRRPECTRATCAEAIRLREAQANKQVRSASLPAFRGTIAPGRWFTLRNGFKAMVTKKATATFVDGETKERKTLEYWQGVLAGGGETFWQIDGYFSPVENGRPHEMDIIGTAVRP
jgi:hypothetical protein